MPTPAEIANAGPWAVLVFCLITGFVGLFTAIIKQLLVPGWLYRAVIEELVESRKEIKELRKAVGQLTGQLASERKRRASDG